MGLIVSVYKDGSGYDCTNNGVTNRADYLCVVNVDGPFEPDPTRPAVCLEPGVFPGTAVITPVEVKGQSRMFGGNYAASSDSRWCRAVEQITGNPFYGAVPVHDRVER